MTKRKFQREEGVIKIIFVDLERHHSVDLTYDEHGKLTNQVLVTLEKSPKFRSRVKKLADKYKTTIAVNVV